MTIVRHNKMPTTYEISKALINRCLLRSKLSYEEVLVRLKYFADSNRPNLASKNRKAKRVRIPDWHVSFWLQWIESPSNCEAHLYSNGSVTKYDLLETYDEYYIEKLGIRIAEDCIDETLRSSSN